ncbi:MULTISPECIES: heme-binding protein [Terrabacteria group]|uniref:heme-binding protein n=1 Tax=Bacillati TaxID=1783272 RepID=UPI001C6E215E|nr:MULTISPECIES: heme-binding protein [Terrabacteria group]MBW9212186.1 heme-binding protein [Trueperella sp. zg.1013]
MKQFVVDKKFIERVSYALRLCAEQNVIGYELFLHGKTILYYSDIQLSLDKGNWIKRKRKTCIRFEQSTLDLSIKNQGDLAKFYLKYGLQEQFYCLTPGSVPIFNEHEQCVGALTITGLTPEEDHKMALEVLGIEGGI